MTIAHQLPGRAIDAFTAARRWIFTLAIGIVLSSAGMAEAQISLDKLGSASRSKLTNARDVPATSTAPSGPKQAEPAPEKFSVTVGLRATEPALTISEAAVSAVQDRFAAKFGLTGQKAQDWQFNRLRFQPVVLLTVLPADLDAIAADPDVDYITVNMEARSNLDDTISLVGMLNSQATSARGNGRVVAVIDDGILNSHGFFGGRVVEEANCPSAGCVTGAGTAAHTGSSTHGTHVSGIAAGFQSAGSPSRGVAPGAQILAVRAIFAGGSVIRSLEHVEARKRAGLPIDAVNLSLGYIVPGSNPSSPILRSGSCSGEYPTEAAAIQRLKGLGVASVVASGNASSQTSVGVPACIPEAVTVGSTRKSDDVSSFSNGGPGLVDLFAPGSFINSSCRRSFTYQGFTYCSQTELDGVTPTTGTAPFALSSGTSMAAPHVAGAFAAIRSVLPNATVDQIEAALKSTGTTINAGTYSAPRIRVDLALQSLGAGTGAKAVMTSPANGSTLPGSSATFSWSTGTNVSAYWLYVGTSAGAFNLHDSGQLTTTSRTVSGLPTNGSTVHVQLWSKVAGSWEVNNYSYTANAGGGAKAVMTSPANGSTLSGSSATFSWTTGTNVSAYWLYAGTTAGANNLHDSGQLSSTSRTVSGLPSNGSTIHVQLWSLVGGGWQANNYTYTATSGGGARAFMISPTNASAINSTTTFTWTTGTNVSAYWLYAGTTAGANNLHDSGQLSTTSRTVSGLPSNSTVYVQLWSLVGGSWQADNYAYTVTSGSAKAFMISPSNGATISSTTTFNWTTGTNVSAYWLYIGTTAGANNLHDSGQLSTTSRTVSGLPANGSTVYVQLWSLIAGSWQFSSYNYVTAAPSNAAVMLTPPNGSVVTNVQTFVWTSVSGATEYWVELGNSPGGANLFSNSTGLATAITIDGFSGLSGAFYFRLWTGSSGNWAYRDYWYFAPAPEPAGMSTSTPGATKLTVAGR
jgi:serine protease